MAQGREAVAAARFLMVLIVLSAVGLSATSRVRRPPSPSSASRAADTPVLEHVAGGGPEGGAVASLAITSSSIIFAGFEHGGVFKSSDRGASWTPADRGLRADDDCELVAVPSSPGTLFAACGDGLFKTTDAGGLWHQLDLDNALPPLVAPSDSRILYQPSMPGIVRSRDGGHRWEVVKTASSSYCAAFAIDPVDPFVLFCGGEEWVSVSRDGGATWSPAGKRPDSSSRVSAIAIDPSSRNTIVVADDDGRIFQTTTGGANWTALGNGPEAGNIEHLQFVGDSGELLFARQDSKLLRSVDGGRQWRVVFGSPHVSILGPPFAVDPISPSVIYLGTDHGVTVTTDGGAQWTIGNRGVTRAATTVAFHDGAPPTLYASNGRELVSSKNDGASWTAVRLGTEVADEIVLSVERRGDDVLAHTSATTYRLRRGESGWLPTAGERDWQPARLPGGKVPSAIAAAGGDPDVLYASTGGLIGVLGDNGIWRSTDAGNSWQLMDRPGNSTIARCCALLPDPRDARTVYAVLQGVGIGGDGDLIRRTIDAGETWTELAHPGLALSTIVVPTNPTTLLVQVMDITGAGRYALFSSTTRGDRWQRVGAGFPTSVRITNVAIDPRQPQHLFAATEGRGVYRSLDAGATWEATGGRR
jgi:photosystem II stability/assembly factor-like uncharacterized protein